MVITMAKLLMAHESRLGQFHHFLGQPMFSFICPFVQYGVHNLVSRCGVHRNNYWRVICAKNVFGKKCIILQYKIYTNININKIHTQLINRSIYYRVFLGWLSSSICRCLAVHPTCILLLSCS